MKSKACNLKSDFETTKMQAMNKYNRGGIGKKTNETQSSKRARSNLSLAETRDTSIRICCRELSSFADKSGTCDLAEVGASTRLNCV